MKNDRLTFQAVCFQFSLIVSICRGENAEMIEFADFL